MTNLYEGVRPSELMGDMDEYTAFCFDEACAFMIQKIRDKEVPVFPVFTEGEETSFRSASELYRAYEKKGITKK